MAPTDHHQGRPALYYPYIHIRNEHWLKATLLCVPTVKRIVPETYTPEDDPIIKRYTDINGPYGPLLQAVPAASPAAFDAQTRLLRILEDHKKEINRKYHRRRALGPDKYWIHTAKFNRSLLEYLTGHQLAWPSADPHGFGHREWFALHPTLGSAIMTTLGLSIAREQHYDIVTPNAKYHETLLATNEDAITETLLNGPRHATTSTVAQTRHDLTQLAITLSGVNYSAIPPEAIPELQASPHLNKFQHAIKQWAASIDRNNDDEVYQSELRQTAGEIVEAWHDTRHDMLKRLKTPVLVAGAALTASALKAHYHVAQPTALVIDAALAIVLLTYHAISALPKRPSPYQYLTEIVAAQDETLRITFPLGIA